MIEVLYIRVPEKVERENLFIHLQGFVSGECYNEVLGYKNKEVALRRLLGETLISFALREYWGLPLGSYRILRGEKGKPFMCFLISLIQENTWFAPCRIGRSGLISKNGLKHGWRLPDAFFMSERYGC